jgi:hypothetical protein
MCVSIYCFHLAENENIIMTLHSLHKHDCILVHSSNYSHIIRYLDLIQISNILTLNNAVKNILHIN